MTRPKINYLPVNGDPNMHLIYDTGYVAKARIYGTDWHMSSEEYWAMKQRHFHYWPHNLKRINPQPHSCARCIHRPLIFQDTKKRKIIPKVPPCPQWHWSNAAVYYENSQCEAGEWP